MSQENNPAPAAPVSATPAPLTEAEVNARIEAVRKEEKQKLYSELEGLKQQVAALDASKQEITKLTAQVTEAQQQLAAVSKAKTATGEIDTIALARQVAENTRAAVAAETNKALSELQAQMKELERLNTQQRLDAIRTQLIADANGQIIAAMVMGNTEAELRASADAARQQYQAIVASVRQPGTTPAAPIVPPPVVQPRTINGGAQPPATGLDAVVRTGDAKAFGKNRQQIMSDLKARFG
jgi:hypothetical protein